MEPTRAQFSTLVSLVLVRGHVQAEKRLEAFQMVSQVTGLASKSVGMCVPSVHEIVISPRFVTSCTKEKLSSMRFIF